QKEFGGWASYGKSYPDKGQARPMRWVPGPAVVLAGACASLVAPGPGSADLAALVQRFSTPPPKALVIDVANGTVGGLRIKAPAATYVRRLGIPDYVGSLESRTKIEM